MGTPTYHHISLHISSQLPFRLNTHPRTVPHDSCLNQVAALCLCLPSVIAPCTRVAAGTSQHSSPRYLRLADYTALLGAPQSETDPASHAYQICWLANGRPGLWWAIRIKGGHSNQPSIQPEGVICLLYFKKEEASRRANLSWHSKE